MGDPLGAKIAQDAIWGASGAPFGCLLGRILAPSWSQDGAILDNLARRCAQKGELGAYLARFWMHLGVFFVSWSRSLQNGRKPKKRQPFITFEGFLDLGTLSEAMLAHLGAMLGRLGSILEQLGDKMWTESAKMSQDSGQERQDKAR